MGNQSKSVSLWNMQWCWRQSFYWLFNLYPHVWINIGFCTFREYKTIRHYTHTKNLIFNWHNSLLFSSFKLFWKCADTNYTTTTPFTNGIKVQIYVHIKTDSIFKFIFNAFLTRLFLFFLHLDHLIFNMEK